MTAVLLFLGAAAAAIAHGSGEEPSVSLTGEATREGTFLVVRYTITNTGPVPVFVRDVMPAYGESGVSVDASSAYAFHEEPDGLRLVRAELQLPEEFDVGSKEVPFARKLAPGQRAEGRIAIEVPVHEASPFYPPPEGWREVACRRVRLVIGWIEEKGGMRPQVRKLGDAAAIALKGGWTAPLQRLAQVTFPVEVPVKRRDGTFDRRMPLE